MLTFIFISYLVLFCIVPYTILCFCQKNECSFKNKKKYEHYSLHSSWKKSHKPGNGLKNLVFYLLPYVEQTQQL